ncbi:Uncharacterised protein [Proteus vulgaris]|nr:Uncharacterised protein [Proteus vulgaris]
MDTLEINGWKIFFHQCFLDQIIELVENVKKLKALDPIGYKKKSNRRAYSQKPARSYISPSKHFRT